MRTRMTTLAMSLGPKSRRALWDLRDRLRIRELAAVIKPAPRPARFNRNGIRILEVKSHAYAR